MHRADRQSLDLRPAGDRLGALDRAMARLAEGEAEAFDVVFDGVWPPALALAKRMLGPGADAEDAAQEAVAKLFQRASSYDPSRAALPWALAFVAWECRTFATRRRRRREDALAVGFDPAQDGPGAADQLEEQQALASVLAALRPEDRATIEAMISGDPEAPARAGLAPATFRKRLERALLRARALWRAHGA